MKLRFTKARQRQLNKFNILLNKKEGNITRANSPNSTNLASQAGRQALLPPGEGSNLAAGRQAGTHLTPREGSILSQAGSQTGTSQASILPQAGSQTGTSQASILPQAGSQAGTLLPPGEGSNLPQAGS